MKIIQNELPSKIVKLSELSNGDCFVIKDVNGKFSAPYMKVADCQKYTISNHGASTMFCNCVCLSNGLLTDMSAMDLVQVETELYWRIRG